MQVRQVVTGHDPDGKAVFVHDRAVTASSLPGVGDICRLWSADGPACYPDAGSDPGAAPFFPPPGGVRFLMTTLPPERHDGDGAAAGIQDDDAGMHTTDTTDFEVVLSGQIALELDGGVEVVLGPGDVVVQNGTRHRWRNVGAVPATMAIVIVGATRA
jgi:mannose-6-phosphate isomerase-like protein (cupin superfamily)